MSLKIRENIAPTQRSYLRGKYKVLSMELYSINTQLMLVIVVNHLTAILNMRNLRLKVVE